MSTKKHIVVAPHADDEIIGCYDVLSQGNVGYVAFLADSKKRQEASKSKQMFGFDCAEFCVDDANFDREIVCHIKLTGGLVFFPDPVYELHPEHRRIGAIGERIVKSGVENIVFYSTNMNAPYIRECKNPVEKQIVLNQCYPHKASLWKYDHKYFLFEGYTMWGINKLLL